MAEVDGGGVSGADRLADVRNSSGSAAVGVVLPVGQAAEHGLTPGCADHQVGHAGLLGCQGIAKVVHATENGLETFEQIHLLNDEFYDWGGNSNAIESILIS
jgi:hypothetical protein